MRRAQHFALDYKRKDRMKVIRTVLEWVVLLALFILFIKTVFTINRYKEPDKVGWSNNQGFIAISYFGVSRSGDSKLISQRLLDRHLKALHDQGYVTISQQDIIDFYSKGKMLPEKALFLAFEDGRNDSALFAQPLLERYNYKATILSYAIHIGNGRNKFLQPRDMLSLMKSGYWELGSNGYRLAYINIFDKEGNFIGTRAENELQDKRNIGYYNHYLMDFIRDENMIPVEDAIEMEARISRDYKAMRDVYMDALGFVPQVYMIMHANAMYEGMNPLVAQVNDKNIRQLFKIHFNREGNAYNDKDSSLYNLTRLQAESYWYTNHLLMKIQKDTGKKMEFVTGDAKRALHWELLSGAAEFIDNRIILTSPPARPGRLYLKNSDNYGNIKLTAKLTGNVVGKQAIYVRYDRKKESYIRVLLEDNKIKVEQKKAGQSPELLAEQTLDEVKWEAEDYKANKATMYTKRVVDGNVAEEGYPTNIKNVWKLEITLEGDRLSLDVDLKPIINNQIIDTSIHQGGVELEAAFSPPKNNDYESDDIYDGVFEDVKITTVTQGKANEIILFSNTQNGLQAVARKAEDIFNSVIDWMIDAF
jgi:hypothetical protein